MTKVSLVRCEDYKLDDVKRSINQTLENLGGLSLFVQPGERVLLKLNLLMMKKPETAATTHPVFVHALTEILQEHGAKVVIGDSPGGPFNEMMLRRVYSVTGTEEVARKTGAELNYNVKSIKRSNPKGLLLKNVTAIALLDEVDKVISVSKLKTHSFMHLTGAVKNQFGIVPGIIKAEYHMNMPDPMTFADALIDICQCSNPVLSLMDGIVGMEGDGPSGGTPRACNAVIGSSSPYHLDKVACTIINVPLLNVPTILRSVERGLCTNDLSDIELVGGDIAAFVIKSYKVPDNSGIVSKINNLPPLLKKFAESNLQPRPVFLESKCVSCGVCMENCPAKVISMRGKFPSVDLKACIRCFCCQELCPCKAVEIKRPFLSGLLFGGKMK